MTSKAAMFIHFPIVPYSPPSPSPSSSPSPSLFLFLFVFDYHGLYKMSFPVSSRVDMTGLTWIDVFFFLEYGYVAMEMTCLGWIPSFTRQANLWIFFFFSLHLSIGSLVGSES